MSGPGAGVFDQVIRIDAQVHGKGAHGGKTTTWQPVYQNVLARRMNLSGNERSLTSAGGQVAVARVEFTIRYRADIDESMRVVHKGKHYAIRHVNNWNEEGINLILTCDTDSTDGR
ncbi:phage head closure protein [Methylobacillus flagellatus]|uniref:phage head closure protein n=1 Tax=Methylobacillus flagellatus TaxID=405 RepID=UPI0010F6F4A8|nr:phage head closure protein [Methylobacillus flagellatus]